MAPSHLAAVGPGSEITTFLRTSISTTLDPGALAFSAAGIYRPSGSFRVCTTSPVIRSGPDASLVSRLYPQGMVCLAKPANTWPMICDFAVVVCDFDL